jgi:hypothetical protein
MEFALYEKVPSMVQEALIKKHADEKAAKRK